jgi:ABC-type Fe3+/spermidine/putrescine transport system ATPase subunit
MREELKTLQRQVGITTVFVTHDQEEALTLADRIAVMNKGVVQQVDTPSALYRRPQALFVADFIGAMNFVQTQYSRARGAFVSGGVGVAASGNWTDGQAVTMAFRPEDVMFVEGDSGVPGQVRRVVNLGHYLEITVDCPGLGAIKVFADGQHPATDGQRLSVFLRRILLYADGTSVTEIDTPRLSRLPPADTLQNSATA